MGNIFSYFFQTTCVLYSLNTFLPQETFIILLYNLVTVTQNLVRVIYVMNKKKYQHCKRNYVVFHASSFIKKSLSNEDFLKQICIHDERRNPIQPLYIKRQSNSVVTRIIFFPITWSNDPCILLVNRSNHFTVFIKLIDCIKYFTHKMSLGVLLFLTALEPGLCQTKTILLQI